MCRAPSRQIAKTDVSGKYLAKETAESREEARVLRKCAAAAMAHLHAPMRPSSNSPHSQACDSRTCHDNASTFAEVRSSAVSQVRKKVSPTVKAKRKRNASVALANFDGLSAALTDLAAQSAQLSRAKGSPAVACAQVQDVSISQQTAVRYSTQGHHWHAMQDRTMLTLHMGCCA